MVTYYVDGSSRENPRVGGWGVYIDYDGAFTETLRGGEELGTNNGMELTASLNALRHATQNLLPSEPITIVSDSRYVIRGSTEWMIAWVRRDFKTRKGQPIAHRDMWMEVRRQAELREKIQWLWVKGHSGVWGNEKADQLASIGAKSVTLSAGLV